MQMNLEDEFGTWVARLGEEIKAVEARLEILWSLKATLEKNTPGTLGTPKVLPVVVSAPPVVATVATVPAVTPEPPLGFVPTKYNRKGRQYGRGRHLRTLTSALNTGAVYRVEQVARILYGTAEKAYGHSSGAQVCSRLAAMGLMRKEASGVYRWLGAKAQGA